MENNLIVLSIFYMFSIIYLSLLHYDNLAKSLQLNISIPLCKNITIYTKK